MKKLIALVMSLILALSLAACGSKPDKQPLIDSFNAASSSFDEVANLVNEYADVVAPELIDALNQTADMLIEYKNLTEEDLTQEQIDIAMEFLNTVPDSMQKIKESIEQDLANMGSTEVDDLGGAEG